MDDGLLGRDGNACAGSFICEGCGGRWTSSFVLVNEAQMCKSCNAWTWVQKNSLKPVYHYRCEGGCGTEWWGASGTVRQCRRCKVNVSPSAVRPTVSPPQQQAVAAATSALPSTSTSNGIKNIVRNDDLSRFREMLMEVSAALKNGSSSSESAGKTGANPTPRTTTTSSSTSRLTCSICYSQFLAMEMVDFGCTHPMTSCQGCVAKFFKTLIASGDIHSFLCLEPTCKKEASTNLIKELVGPVIFDKLDNLWLEEALTDFPEIVKCPKPHCQKRVVSMPESAYCGDCDFRFCTECNQEYHDLEPCGLTAEERRQAVLQGNRETEQSVRRKQNEDSMKLIKSTYKKCPSCPANIERTEGCYHMVCSRCRTEFCWICMKTVNPKDPGSHFTGSTCVLFDVPPEN